MILLIFILSCLLRVHLSIFSPWKVESRMACVLSSGIRKVFLLSSCLNALADCWRFWLNCDLSKFCRSGSQSAFHWALLLSHMEKGFIIKYIWESLLANNTNLMCRGGNLHHFWKCIIAREITWNIGKWLWWRKKGLFYKTNLENAEWSKKE